MVKYIIFWEYCPEDVEKVIAKSLKSQEAVKKNPEKYSKTLFPPHHMGYCKGFTIVDVADPQQMTNSHTYWFPEMKLKYVPITSNEDMLTSYQELQKHA